MVAINTLTSVASHCVGAGGKAGHTWPAGRVTAFVLICATTQHVQNKLTRRWHLSQQLCLSSNLKQAENYHCGDKKMVPWCIRLTCLTCDVIQCCFVQLQQIFERLWFGSPPPFFSIWSSLVLSRWSRHHLNVCSPSSGRSQKKEQFSVPRFRMISLSLRPCQLTFSSLRGHVHKSKTFLTRGQMFF